MCRIYEEVCVNFLFGDEHNLTCLKTDFPMYKVMIYCYFYAFYNWLRMNLNSLMHRKLLKLRSDYHYLRSSVWKSLADTWFSWIFYPHIALFVLHHLSSRCRCLGTDHRLPEEYFWRFSMFVFIFSLCSTLNSWYCIVIIGL